MKGLLIIVMACMVVFLTACSDGLPPVEGFVLPQGDVAKGKQVFIKFNCYSCHSIKNVELPKAELEPPFVMPIGARLHRVKNSGELLTAIVYPDHVISPKYVAMLKNAGKQADLTPMPDFGSQMTIDELVDLVAFLNEQYTLLLPTYYKSHYPAVR